MLNEIKIVDIDKETIERNDSFTELMAFYVILNNEPDEDWKQIFANRQIIGISPSIHPM